MSNQSLLSNHEAQLSKFRDEFQRAHAAIGQAILGSDALIQDALVAICSGGHVLLEGVPGLGKTSLVKALSTVLGLDNGRIQCTPDLMPADILGTHIVNEDSSGRCRMIFERGPVFRQVLLVDEINRAPPKTQAALLQAMQEYHVSTGQEDHQLPQPFFVLATQNPLEMEGTYPLPEAQLDRFLFKLNVAFPTLETLVAIGQQTSGFDETQLEAVWDGEQLVAWQKFLATIPVAQQIATYAGRIILATHPDNAEADATVQKQISYGASPRAIQALIRAARVNCALRGGSTVSCEDIDRVALPTLRHRIIRNFEGEAEGLAIDGLIQSILNALPKVEA